MKPELKPLYEDMDAARWAREFKELLARPQEIDEGLLIAWFSNAILCGYDTAIRRSAPSAEEVRLHGPWSHWREPHCCGCWVITVKDGGPVASCNECSLEVDLLKILEEHTMRLSQDVAMPFSGSMEAK